MLLFATFAAANHVAVVTGGTRGIGRGIAESLARRGYDLLLAYHSDAGAAEAVRGQLCEKYGVRVACVGGDLALESARDKLYEI